MARGTCFYLIGRCLLLLWLLYGGLELAEELKAVEKADPCAHDLDMEALLHLASGIKPEVPSLESLSDSPTVAISAVEVSSPRPSSQPSRIVGYPPWSSASRRLHQYLSVYRI